MIVRAILRKCGGTYERMSTGAKKRGINGTVDVEQYGLD
jgi:hypothetical protein